MVAACFSPVVVKQALSIARCRKINQPEAMHKEPPHRARSGTLGDRAPVREFSFLVAH
jgi:hypothetical protein